MSLHTPSTPPRTASGITGDATGNRVIPSSRRADGSIRKERKVKPGFTPQEDVQRFRPRRLQEQDALRAAGNGRTVPGAARGPSIPAPTSSSSSSSSRSATPSADDAWPSLSAVSGSKRHSNAPANGMKTNGTAATNGKADSSTPVWRRAAPLRKEEAPKRTSPIEKKEDEEDAPDDWEKEADEDSKAKSTDGKPATSKTTPASTADLEDALAALSVGERSAKDQE